MRFIAWHMALAGWLLLSSFALPYGENGMALTALLAVFIGTVGLAAPGLPGLRFGNTLLAMVLAATALLMAGMEWPARINSLVVAAVVFALSVIPGRSWGPAMVKDEPGA
jgi:energy-converting hydrogenase Eha subunit B